MGEISDVTIVLFKNYGNIYCNDMSAFKVVKANIFFELEDTTRGEMMYQGPMYEIVSLLSNATDCQKDLSFSANIWVLIVFEFDIFLIS